MSIEIRWIVSSLCSALHAGRAIIHNLPPADSALAAALAEPAAILRSETENFGISAAALYDHLIPLAASGVGHRQLVEVALAKLQGESRESVVSVLDAAVRALASALDAQHPDLMKELELRAPVIREQWNARGPGLLRIIGRLTDPDLIPSRADIVLVHPILGGAATAFLPYNTVLLEAVLANPHTELPEIVHLGWLLGQLNFEAPIWSETVPGHRLPMIAQAAMVAPTLAAAQEVELARFDPENVERSLTFWRVVENDVSRVAESVWSWWQGYQQSRPRWSVALAALDRLIGEV